MYPVSRDPQSVSLYHHDSSDFFEKFDFVNIREVNDKNKCKTKLVCGLFAPMRYFNTKNITGKIRVVDWLNNVHIIHSNVRINGKLNRDGKIHYMWL